MTMKIANRIARMGTETAFAVSAEAAAFAAKGNVTDINFECLAFFHFHGHVDR